VRGAWVKAAYTLEVYGFRLRGDGLVVVEGLVLAPFKALGIALLEVSLSIILLAASARLHLDIPGLPVPFTLQTLALQFLACVLGVRAPRVLLAYLALGLAGAPVFAHGGGPGYVLSPSFGYLLGFPIAAYVAGMLARPATYRRLLAASLTSLVPVYALGASWLGAWIHYSAGVGLLESLRKAVVTGMLVFIPWDVFKAFMAAALSIPVLRAYRAIR